MDAADFYSGIVADAYAKLKSVSFSPEPYAKFVREAGEPGLEIGCGDGEPLLDLCAKGLDVDGVDSSLDMVLRCRQNAADRGLSVAVHHQRVEELSLSRRYGAIYFAGPTFNLLPDDETALRALRSIRTHLRVDGSALIPLWIPEPTPATELGQTREVDDDGVRLRYTPVSETFDPDQRTRVTATRYERVTPRGVDRVDREWTIHWHTSDGFQKLCEETGLVVVGSLDTDSGGEASEASVEFTATVRQL